MILYSVRHLSCPDPARLVNYFRHIKIDWSTRLFGGLLIRDFIPIQTGKSRGPCVQTHLSYHRTSATNGASKPEPIRQPLYKQNPFGEAGVVRSTFTCRLRLSAQRTTYASKGISSLPSDVAQALPLLLRTFSRRWLCRSLFHPAYMAIRLMYDGSCIIPFQVAAKGSNGEQSRSYITGHYLVKGAGWQLLLPNSLRH